MKPVALSADSAMSVYMVPDIVAENLYDYCMEFCRWIHNDPIAVQKYRHCYCEEQFIEYLNAYLFPDQPSYGIDNVPPVFEEDDLPSEYREIPYFNF